MASDRDEVARLLDLPLHPHTWYPDRGVLRCAQCDVWQNDVTLNGRCPQGHHPIPTDLDGLIALLPQQWRWERNHRASGTYQWAAMCVGRDTITVYDTGNHAADFTSLLLKVLTHEAQQAGGGEK